MSRALRMSRPMIWSGLNVGYPCFTSAAEPATSGDEADVPAKPDGHVPSNAPYVALDTLS
jgi:hypothetical protein